MKLFFDDRQTQHAPLSEMHNGDWVPFAETPGRARQIAGAMQGWQGARDFGRDPILAVHAPDYVAFLEEAHGHWLADGRTGDAIGYTFPIRRRRALPLQRIDARLGAYSYDAGTPVSAGTWESAYWSAQTALTALDDLIRSGDRHAFALCRPPGHHAGADYMGGYCYLNSAAIAARQAQAEGYAKVAVLDIDYHHGNGTQDIFYEDGSVFFCSIHADPCTDYPFYWGHADERGARAGEGATLNLPLPRGTGGAAFSQAVDLALASIAEWGADFLIVSFGADTHESDPISFFMLTQADYPLIARQIAAVGMQVLVLMEGGYAVANLGDNVAAFLSGFEA